MTKKLFLIVFTLFLTKSCFAPRQGHPFSNRGSAPTIDADLLLNEEELARLKSYTTRFCSKCHNRNCTEPKSHKAGLCKMCNNPVSWIKNYKVCQHLEIWQCSCPSIKLYRWTDSLALEKQGSWSAKSLSDRNELPLQTTCQCCRDWFCTTCFSCVNYSSRLFCSNCLTYRCFVCKRNYQQTPYRVPLVCPLCKAWLCQVCHLTINETQELECAQCNAWVCTNCPLKSLNPVGWETCHRCGFQKTIEK